MRTARTTSAAALFLAGTALLLFGPPPGAAAAGLPLPVGPGAGRSDLGHPGPGGGPGAQFPGLAPGPRPAGPGAGASSGGRLAVTYSPDGAHRFTYTVSCGRFAGDEDALDGDACARLRELGGPLGAVPEGQLCTMIYGGPQTATVTGVWNGQPRSETYRRTNGCEVTRWSRMVPVLPAPGGPQEQSSTVGGRAA